MPTTYSISDLARELDITTRTIRFYEEQGMLTPERRGQERIYSARDKVTLKLILRGKRIGFSRPNAASSLSFTTPPATTNNSKPSCARLPNAANSCVSNCSTSNKCNWNWTPRKSAASPPWRRFPRNRYRPFNNNNQQVPTMTYPS